METQNMTFSFRGLASLIFVLLGHGILLSISSSAAAADNILVNPLHGQGSHFYLSAAIGEQLVKKGYNVSCLISNAFEDHVRGSRFGTMFKYEVFKHPIPVEKVHEMFSNLSACFTATDWMTELTVIIKLLKARQNDCRALLEDDILMNRLKSANFSAVLYDMTWVCGAIVGQALDVPYFTIVPFPNPCLNTAVKGAAFNPAMIPFPRTTYTNNMEFKERVSNLIFSIIGKYVTEYMILKPYNAFSKKFGISDPMDLYRRSPLWLVNSDFIGEYPCALPPNAIPVGGLTVRDPDPEEFSSDLEEFIQGSGDNGIIVCSFGSFLSMGKGQLKIIEMFSNVFGRLPQRIVWALKTEPPFPLPQNVRIVKWLPQNDILGHQKTKGFFFHGGQNSFYEAIYHGIPAVIMPICADQMENAVRAVHFGFALKVDVKALKPDRLYDALREITTNDTYTKNVRRMSAAFRHRPMKPAERAAFWVDHVIKHGAEYLEIPVQRLNFFQYYLIDVMSFILFVVITTAYVFMKCCVFSCRLVSVCKVKDKSKVN